MRSLALNELDYVLAKIDWCDEQTLIIVEVRKARLCIEKVGGVVGDLIVGCEHAKIRVDA